MKTKIDERLKTPIPQQSIIGTLDDADAQIEAVETLLKTAEEDVLPGYMANGDSAINKVDILLLVSLEYLHTAREQMKTAIEQAIAGKEEDQS